MRAPLAALGLALAIAGAAPAHAQDVQASQPDTVVAALRGAGYQAKLTRDKVGDPMIESRASGAKFQVFFYGCTKGADCNAVQLSAGFIVPKKRKPSLARINTWNHERIMTKASVDKEGDPYLVASLPLGRGVAPEHFMELVEAFDSDLGDFVKAFVD